MLTTKSIERSGAVADLATDPSLRDGTQSSSQPSATQHPETRSWAATLVWLSLLAGAFGAGWWVANSRANQEERIGLPASQAKDFANALPVTAEPIVYRAVQRTIQAVGTLHGYEEVSLSAKVEGRVTKVFHDLSSRVAPGELLIEIDTTDAKLAVQQAERNLQAELAKWGFDGVPPENADLTKLPTVVSARLRYELASTQYERMKSLRATNSIALEELEKSRSETLVLESDWKNQLLLAQSAAATSRLKNADLAIAQQRLSDTQIRAPIPTLAASEGDQFYRVSERLVSEGSMLRVGTEVMKIVLGDTLKLRLAVPEAYGNAVQVGQKVDVLSAANERPSYGTVARISPIVDRATRTFLVEVEVLNKDGALKPGGFVKANINVGVNDRATTIPLAGLYSFAGINKLFVYEDGKAREVQVTLGEQSDSWVEIVTPPLPQESLIITSGQRLLSEGKEVAIREPQAIDSAAKSNTDIAPTPANESTQSNESLSTIGHKQ